MFELMLTGFIAGVLAYSVMAALLDPRGESLQSLGF